MIAGFTLSCGIGNESKDQRNLLDAVVADSNVWDLPTDDIKPALLEHPYRTGVVLGDMRMEWPCSLDFQKSGQRGGRHSFAPMSPVDPVPNFPSVRITRTEHVADDPITQ